MTALIHAFASKKARPDPAAVRHQEYASWFRGGEL